MLSDKVILSIYFGRSTHFSTTGSVFNGDFMQIGFMRIFELATSRQVKFFQFS